MQFSLYYFANQEGPDHEKGKYRLIMESARWADRNGFARLWTPERHFHSFGGLSPNPSILSAALASTTERIQLCSGSVVLPLHDPIRVAEEWAVVDNLSDGRVGLGVACGWVPNDFVISGSQDKFDSRKDVFAENIDALRALWRGERRKVRNPKGEEIEITTLPRPIQPEVPIWITAAANPETFRFAGEIGANLLTHLLGQTLQGLSEKVAIYRDAWQKAGHPGRGTMTLMLHTFVDEDEEEAKERVREPFKRYLLSSVDLWRGEEARLDDMPPRKRADLLEFAFERYWRKTALMGSPSSCTPMVEAGAKAGVDEIACLIDFGVPTEEILSSMSSLDELRQGPAGR